MTQVAPLLNEASSNLVLDLIKSTFNTKLTELDNQYPDGINLEPLSDQNVYISDKIETLGLPAVYVLFGNMAFDYSDRPNFLNGTNECLVIVTAEDVGAESLTRKMWRYGRIIYSILNLVDLKSADGRLQIHCVPKRMAYSDQRVTAKLNKMEQRFRQDCVLELELQHFENNLTDV